MKTSPRKLAFVLPRFGAGFMGGAESLCGALGVALQQRGYEIEILTTCAKDNRTWENELKAGESFELGLLVRRFPVSPRNLDRWVPLQIQISKGQALSPDQQFEWMQNSITSYDLFEWIAKHSKNYDLLIFAPYLFGTTFWGALIDPQRSLLLPCLHDESYAYVEIIAQMFKMVRGCLFNANAEAALCRRLYGAVAGGEVGMGFELPTDNIPPEPAYNFPYLLCMGRKETGKNVHLLIDLFRWYQKNQPTSELRLLIVGGGDFADLHRDSCERVIDVERVSEERKRHLMRDALALVQPSTNESFSIVLMEAWLEGCPVIVNGNCAVTREHVLKSNGGLFFEDEIDFYAAIEALENQTSLRQQLASAGKAYVQDEYSWSAVVDRFESVVANI